MTFRVARFTCVFPEAKRDALRTSVLVRRGVSGSGCRGWLDGGTASGRWSGQRTQDGPNLG